MTGESEPVKKTPAGDASLIGGCLVLEGEGRMLVTAVGPASKIGQTVSLVEGQEAENTPLQDKLEALANDIGRVGTLAGALTFFVLTALWWAAPPAGLVGKDWTALLRFFIVGITIVVVAVPEGLPLAVTISLAFSMRRMMKDNNLVRELAACETMGSATVIASDKTGTLTQNRMTVVQGWAFGRFYERLDRLRVGIANPGAAHRLAKAIALNSTAELRIEGPRVEYVRNPSEGALLLMLLTHLGADYMREREEAGPPLARRPFKKEDKFMTTICAPEAAGEGPVAYCKGAPEIVLGFCTSTQAPGGALSPITEEVSFNLKEQVGAMARTGLRTLAVAYRRLPPGPPPAGGWAAAITAGKVECEMVLLGLFGLADPLREDVADAITRCQAAGIRVMMVTGDHRDTAAHIATQCGILRPGGLVLEGPQFRAMLPEERAAAAPMLAVLARSSPTDKHLLVTTLKAMGEVVAVTGDGTNDAPALRAADVGLAMGIAGTEVAKEASDIIVLDDRFASIVASVKWGRSIKENIRKFLTFQLTINIVALTLTFVTACANGGSTDAFPLKPVQLLWVNLIMDSFAALALATEPPSEHLLDFAPQGKSERLITRTMAKNMVGHAAFQTALLLWLTMTSAGNEFFGIAVHGSVEHYTVIFTTFVILQVFNLFNCRTTHDEWNVLADFGSSVIGQVIVGLIVGMQVLIVQFGGAVAQTAPLTLHQWALCTALGFLSVPVGYILKLVPACDRELRKLSPAPLRVPAGPLYAEPTAVRGAFVRAMSAAVEEDAAGEGAPVVSGTGVLGRGGAAVAAARARAASGVSDVSSSDGAAHSVSPRIGGGANGRALNLDSLAAATSTSSHPMKPQRTVSLAAPAAARADPRAHAPLQRDGSSGAMPTAPSLSDGDDDGVSGGGGGASSPEVRPAARRRERRAE